MNTITFFFTYIPGAVSVFAGQYLVYFHKNLHAGLWLFAAGAVFITAGEMLRQEKPGKDIPESVNLLNDSKQVRKENIIFVLIIFSALFFCMYKIGTVPDGAHRDEADSAISRMIFPTV